MSQEADAQTYTKKLTHSRILILGGSSGLGHGLALACIEHSARVIICSSNATRLATAIEKIQHAYPSQKQNISGLTIDLSNLDTLERELERVFEEAVERMGVRGGERALDHVVYTAGDTLRTMEIGNVDVDTVIKAGAVRFFAPLMTAKFVQRFIVASPASSFTITTGSVSERPVANWSVVAAYAGGLHSMVRNLAVDLKPVRVNGVSPGAVNTELWASMGEERERTFRQFEERLLTGEVGRVEDVVETYLMLLKNRNATGSMIRSDGGGLIV